MADEPHVRALERGLSVLRVLGPEPLTLAEVARAAGLDRAAARRSLHTLRTLGYVGADGRLWSLRPRVLELGHAYLQGLGLPEVARPHLDALSALVGESCSVSILDGHEVVYVARVEVRRIMRVTIAVGTRFPAELTSMGRVLLAGAGEERYADVREQGFALADQELEEGLRSLAVPIRGTDGTVVAAMNISVAAARRTPAAMRRDLLGPLRAAAAATEEDLGRIG